MAKVFRFHQGSDHIEDWQNSSAYGKTAIEGIKDPSGATPNKEITSIPSPFARIDLVKTAFEHIVNDNDLDGNTIFHKMVSEAFDVGEILFNIDKYHDKVNIIAWDIKHDLGTLLNSLNPKHRLLGDTLKLYLEQDSAAYNFDKTERIYLLNYKEGKDELNIIGGTSPITLFFTSANKLDYVNIRFGNHRAFNEEYLPLYKRDINFLKFLFGYRREISEFSKHFKAVDEYLNLTFKKLSAEQRTELQNYNSFEDDFEKLTIQGGSNFMEILGYALRKKTEKSNNIEEVSGFVIQSDKYLGEKKPLVLPTETYTDKTVYTSALWNRENNAPYTDTRDLKDRTLPFVDDRYPYLTISDFLEPYLIRTIYPLHAEKFFDGNLSVHSKMIENGYLLPINKKYFDFFDIDDLTGLTKTGKKTLEINQSVSGGVKVILRIPIKDNKYITYERTYYPPAEEYQIKEPEIERNRGAIIEHQFGVSIYPFLKIESGTDNHYRVALIDHDILPHTLHNNFSLGFFNTSHNAQLKEVAAKQRSNKRQDDEITSTYYVLDDSFDYIELKTSYATGLIIPKLRLIKNGHAQFNFSIDFGTTNTHIEYTKDNSEPRPLEINEDDQQIGTLYNYEDPKTKERLELYSALILNEILDQEFVPKEIQLNKEYQFPQRTVINYPKTLDLDQSNYTLADFNIPFVYEKHNIHSKNVESNLKWSDIKTNPNAEKKIDAFFENLLLLIRNKVLLNDGNLSKTKLTWLYPSSMSRARINTLETKWNQLFEQLINKEYTPEKVSESIVPYYYYKKKGISAISQNVVSVDIGGGTTDIVVYKDNKAQVLSSFRFAANSIFGDPYGKSSSINGFVLTYLGRFQELLETNSQYELIQVLQEIQTNGKSEDIISFLFSIEKNKNVIESNHPISFSKELANNTDFKIIFITFYVAIIYHIANLLKAQQIEIPRNIIFSGTGSKAINVIDGSKKLTILAELTTAVFEKVYETKSKELIRLNQVENPKEISAKGALLIEDAQNINVRSIKKTLIFANEESNDLTYNDITTKIEDQVLEDYHNFIELLFSLNKELSFKDYFEINPKSLKDYKKYLTENALDDLKQGLQERIKELDDELDVPIDETLFFYPLVGALNHLAFNIYEDLNQ